MVTILFLKNCFALKTITINRPSNLSLLNEKNNGFTTNDW